MKKKQWPSTRKPSDILLDSEEMPTTGRREGNEEERVFLWNSSSGEWEWNYRMLEKESKLPFFIWHLKKPLGRCGRQESSSETADMVVTITLLLWKRHDVMVSPGWFVFSALIQLELHQELSDLLHNKWVFNLITSREAAPFHLHMASVWTTTRLTAELVKL